MTESGGDWASPGGGSDWTPPTYAPSYPQGYAPPPTAAPQPPPPHPGWAPGWTPMPGVVPLRPLGLGELLDGAVKIIRRYPKPTLVLSAVLTAVTTLVDVVFILLLDSSTTITSDSTAGETFSDSFTASPSTVLNLFSGAVLTGALVAVVSRAVLGQSATVKDAWDATRPRLWALIGVSLSTLLIYLLPAVLVFLGFLVAGPLALLLLLAVLPLEVYLWTVLSLAPPALVLERIGVFAALKRSQVLGQRGFWRVFGVLALTYLITTVIASILAVPVVIVGGIASFDSGTIGSTYLVVLAVVSGLVQVVIAPYSAGMRALLYVDQRMRTEGLDVALQAAAATGTDAPA